MIRAIAVEELLGLFQEASFHILVCAGLGPARDRAKVLINSGLLLRALAANGSSFSRFIRTLRMGLGNPATASSRTTS